MYNKLDGLNARTITYTYNRLGELTYRHMNGNTHRWWYTYNNLGQLKLVRTNTSTTQVTDADYSVYWPGGMMQTEVLGNQTINYGYDARDRLLDINNVGSSTPRFSARYTYFANGNINVAQFRQPSTPHSHKRYRYTHSYDNRNQLTGANYNYLSGSTWTNSNEFDVTGLSYDRDGNIQALSRRFEGLKTYSYSYTSGTNRLASVNKNGSNISFGYDGNGNVTTIGTGYSITNMVYNWSNLPTSITKSGTTYNYRYDHAGLRVYKQEGDNIHTLRGAFGEVLATYKNGSLDYWNIVRPDGTVIGRREGSTRLYYHRDHLGSTRAVVNASGTVVQTYDYYPFGLEMPGRSLTTGSTARERFTGHERDEEVGLDYMQARRYAAEFGRFLSVDPHAHNYPGTSLYAYVANNPMIFIDPDGRDVWEINRDGHMVRRIEDDTQDAFHIVDSDGKRIDGLSIVFKYGTVQEANEGEGITTEGLFEYLSISINDDNDATGLFEFFAVNTGVEWSRVQFGESGNFVATGHQRRKEPAGAYLMYKNHGKLKFRSHTHSHPSGTGSPSDGDRAFAEWVNKNNRFPDVRLYIYQVGKGSYVSYNHK